MVITTIKISKETKEELDKFKVHPRQSYDEVLQLLIKSYTEHFRRKEK